MLPILSIIHQYIHSFIHETSRLSVKYISFHLFISLSIHPRIHTPIQSFTLNLFIDVFILYACIDLSIFSSFIHSSIRPYFHQSMQLSTQYDKSIIHPFQIVHLAFNYVILVHFFNRINMNLLEQLQLRKNVL